MDPCWVVFAVPNAVCLLRSLYNLWSTEMCFTEWEIHSLIRSCPLWRHRQVELECALCRVCSLWQAWLDLCALWIKSYPKLWHLRVQLWSETLPAAVVKPPQQQCICMWWEAGKCCFSLPTWMNKKLRYKEIKKDIWRWISPKPSRVTHCSIPLKTGNSQVWLLGCLKHFQPKTSELDWDKHLFLSLWNCIFQHSCPTAVIKTAGLQGDPTP